MLLVFTGGTEDEFLYCCPDCPTHLNSFGRATWACEQHILLLFDSQSKGEAYN